MQLVSIIYTRPSGHTVSDFSLKSCYNPLGTVIVLVSSGIDFVNTPRCIATEPPAERDCQFGLMVCARRSPKFAWTLQETHRNYTSYARDEARTYVRLLDRQTP